MDQNIKTKIQESFKRQGFMQTLGARLISIAPGEVKMDCAFQPGLTQQHGYFHAGVVTSIVDVACGYAALSQMPPEATVLSVEFKTNFIRPAQGNKIIAIGKVIKSGRTLTICEGTVMDETETIIFAKMLTTMINKTS